jgi:hypothetical protein
MEVDMAVEQERQRIIVSLRPTFWGCVMSFALSLALIVCLFLGARLLTCCGGAPGAEMLNLSQGRVALVLVALAFALTLQRPRSALQGLWAGIGTAAVATGVGAGFCGGESLRGSMLFLAGAPVISGVVLGLAQHDKALD